MRVDVNTDELRRMTRDPEGPVGALLMRYAVAVTSDARRRVQEPPKTGRWYHKHNPERWHQASAPDESPATDLGTLVQSIKPDDLPTETPEGLKVRVGSEVRYAHILEVGGRTGKGHRTYIAPRPYLRPALNAQRGGPTVGGEAL